MRSLQSFVICFIYAARKCKKLVKAAVVPHNFVKFHDGSYCPPDYVDRFEGHEIVKELRLSEVPTPLQNQGRMTGNNATKNAFTTRDKLKDYIMFHRI